MNTIYCFVNKINNKRYVGSTIVEPKKRYNQHKYNAFHENAHQYNYPLYQAFRKYGIDNFDYIVLEQLDCTEIELRQKEKEYIEKYNTLSPNGYNQTIDTIHPINAVESYAKMSETKRNQSLRVAEYDNDTKEIINIWRSIVDCAEQEGLGEKHLGGCCRGERHTTSNRYFCWIDDNGNLLIPEYVGETYKGTAPTQQQKTNKKVAQIDINTNQILNIYNSIAEAGRAINADRSAITKVCKHHRNECAGYIWKYIEEIEGKEL
jgi:group I intron endonuclease